jgi:hypothetical protein
MLGRHFPPQFLQMFLLTISIALRNMSSTLWPWTLQFILPCFIWTSCRILTQTPYTGISAVEMAKCYNGEVMYNQEGKSVSSFPHFHPYTDSFLTDDTHITTLTVAQMLNFALSTKILVPKVIFLVS